MATHNGNQTVSMDIHIPGDETCPARLVTIQVPITSARQGNDASVYLQQLLTDTVPEIVSLGLTTEQAAGYIQSKINQYFE